MGTAKIHVQSGKLELTEWQIKNLAKPFVNMLQQYTEFFQNPENEKGFNEWMKQNKEGGADAI